MNWPQFFYLLLLVIGLGTEITKHGQPRTGKHNGLAQLVGSLLALWLLYMGGFFSPAHAAEVPAEAYRHRAELTRQAREVWGLDAPVATFAAQIHQESRWRTEAKSPVGAEGLAQFMPATARWISGAYPQELAGNTPYAPGWALRALLRYDRHLFERVSGAGHCERMAFVLSAYNGGLTWVRRDQVKAGAQGLDPSRWFGQVETVNAGRSAAAWRENRGYPRRILLNHEPTYEQAGFGLGSC